MDLFQVYNITNNVIVVIAIICIGINIRKVLHGSIESLVEIAKVGVCLLVNVILRFIFSLSISKLEIPLPFTIYFLSSVFNLCMMVSPIEDRETIKTYCKVWLLMILFACLPILGIYFAGKSLDILFQR